MGTRTRRLRHRFGGLLTVAVLALLAITHPLLAAAQDEGDTLQYSDLEGIQAAVSRTFTIDFTQMFAAEGTPTPETGGQQLFALGGTIVQFDSGDHAKAAYSTILDQVTNAPDSATPEAAAFETVDLGGDLGDERTGLRIAGDASSGIAGGDIVALVVRDGSLIYLITGIANSGDPGDAVVAFAKVVIDGKAGSDQATFNEDGTSSGGLWDKFPPAGDPSIVGLPSVLDTDPMNTESGM